MSYLLSDSFQNHRFSHSKNFYKKDITFSKRKTKLEYSFFTFG